MVTRVLDTNVVAKWFFEEDGTDRALAHLTELLEGGLRVKVPPSLFYELANVIWTRRSETFTEQQAREVWAELATFPISVTEASDLLPEALAFAFQHDVTAYDAVFVVLARRLGCDLITDDRTLWERVAGACPWVKRL
jgi:predicted nucleic acid-binding protein